MFMPMLAGFMKDFEMSMIVKVPGTVLETNGTKAETGSGAMWKLGLVWGLADMLNGLMALPNLIALVLLSPVVFRLTREYFAAK